MTQRATLPGEALTQGGGGLSYLKLLLRKIGKGKRTRKETSPFPKRLFQLGGLFYKKEEKLKRSGGTFVCKGQKVKEGHLAQNRGGN